MPGDISYGTGFASNQTDYNTAVILPNSGHLNVTVSPQDVTVDYIRAFLPGDGINGQVAYSYTIPADSGGEPSLEWGVVSAGGNRLTVELEKNYDNPVVVCSVQYATNIIPLIARVSNVTSTSFDLRLQNPSDGTVSAENVSYLVVEEGTWNINGTKFEAHTYLSTVTDSDSSWVGQPQIYGQVYSNPVVLGQVMSENDSDWSVFWCRGSSQTSPPSAGTIGTGKTVCEDSDTSRANETIGYIVFETGHGILGGVEYEAFLGNDTIEGVGNSPPYIYNFNTAFSTSSRGHDCYRGRNGRNKWGVGANTRFLSCNPDQSCTLN